MTMPKKRISFRQKKNIISLEKEYHFFGKGIGFRNGQQK